MKNHSFTVVLIESEDDRKAHYLATGFKPDLGAAMVKGCFGGETCSNIQVLRNKNESYIQAISRRVQDEIDEPTLFQVKK